MERAISHHRMERARGQEWLPLLPALLAEPLRLRRDRGDTGLESSWRRHSYQDRGCYSRQLTNLLRWFPQEQVLVLSSDSLRREHESTLRKIYAFLNIGDRSFMPKDATVFAGDPDPRSHRLARAFLKARFAGEDSRVRQWLPDGRIEG